MTQQNFHNGELRLQDKTGMRERIDVMSRHMMRDFMPDEHRTFFKDLEYIFLGTVEGAGLPHATILTGSAGFIDSPDPQTLTIQTGDRRGKAALGALRLDAPVGVLGLDLSNRRRNRMHGRVAAMDETSLTIRVVQSYGNCPKYISLRDVAARGAPAESGDVVTNTALDDAAKDLVQSADTFFIASYVKDGSAAPYEGVDISHRGGQPGFVTVDSPTQITIPDYKGNYLFNTFGNLLLNPSAGLLFLDFETGAQLHIQGTASIIDDVQSVAQFPGAQRLLRVQVNHVSRELGATPLRWRFVETSPFSPNVTRKGKTQ
ncbi:pyridoxamine 5'-phosphate oxidase family protein [Tateyamaria sp. SN3-11]|uniref:pyridoxamine 5'-phosphate oxidase family protein n=1 Tax=Tateyamaria sp. SN3-11 TaxID=3092147 RepID=UPI0039EB327B